MARKCRKWVNSDRTIRISQDNRELYLRTSWSLPTNDVYKVNIDASLSLLHALMWIGYMVLNWSEFIGVIVDKKKGFLLHWTQNFGKCGLG